MSDSTTGGQDRGRLPEGTGSAPQALRLHVERIAKEAQVLTFRDMCGESAYIHPSQLTFIKKIGTGSFARVDFCRLTLPGEEQQRVAVKRLKETATASVAQFASEANVLRGLSHQNVVGFIGVGSSENDLVRQLPKASCYIVQEYIDSGTLKQKVWSQASLLGHLYSDHDAVEWAQQIATGLAYLHRHSPTVLHRDLKLENILLQSVMHADKHRRLEAKICDFGLAVSVLDPKTLGLSHQYQEGPNSPPSGINEARMDACFHNQQRQKARAVQQQEVPVGGERLDTGLKRLSSNPPFQSGKTMTRGTLIRDSPAPPSPRVQQVASRLPSLTSFRKRLSRISKGVGEPPVHNEAYQLTGRAGSYLYMAPEVLLCQPYNEKADVFSLGVILLELFLRKPLAAVLREIDDSPNASEMFAYKVAAGYRHPLPKDWPQELQEIIAGCWHQNPSKRPSAADVASSLDQLERSDLLQKWGRHPEKKKKVPLLQRYRLLSKLL